MSFRMSLRTKILMASILVLTPVLLVLIVNYSTAYETQKGQVLADQVRVAQVVSVAVDGHLDEAIAIARSYERDPVILSFDRDRINRYLATLASLYPEFDDPLGVFDARGNLVGSAIGYRPINVADRKWFQDVMRTGGPIISDVLISRTTGRPIVVAAVAIVDEEGRRVGAVAPAINLEHLPKTLASVERAPGQHIFLTDRTGRLAFYTARPELTWEERDIAGYPPVMAALEGRPYAGEVTDSLLGDRRMVATTATPAYGWVVGVSIPLEVALAPVQDSLRLSLVIFIGVVVLTIGLALVVAQFLLQPLRQLTVSAIALGQGDLQRRARIETGDELERLGESFNSMADEVQRALKLREEFLSVAAHELRTPLTIIRGYAQLLTAKEKDDDKRKRLQVIIRQTDRMGELLNEMMLMSEIRAGHVVLHKQRLDVGALAKETVERMQLLTEKHRLLFRDAEAVFVEADRYQLEVVLTNLIDNAIRYSPQGGDVEIAVSKTNTEAIVSVKDYGLGIPVDKLKHVFEPFFQIYPAIAGFGGMGLGLFICREIVERHGGRIWFVSEEGKGSVFSFALPLATPNGGGEAS